MMRETLTCDQGAAALPEAEQNRLAQILDDYLVAMERGAAISPDELLARHPADAEYLRLYLSGLTMLQAAAGGAGPRAAKRRLHEFTATPAESIGEFTIVREIGRGGMGVVYEAVQTSLRRRVALKVLPFSAARDAKQIGRFKNEAQAAAQVHHPHIVPIYAVGESAGVHFFAMQLIDGASLAEIIGEGRSEATAHQGDAATVLCDVGTRPEVDAHSPNELPTPSQSLFGRRQRLVHEVNASERARTAASMGQQAAAALHAAHEYGVIHRDVKPSNLLVDRQGKLWVADFGLARCREGTGLTQTGDVCGTMRYMSPEQTLGRAELVDHRTDVYSLGVTLYELATLHHPAEGVGGEPLLAGCNAGASRPLRQWNRSFPVDFETIVMKAIAESRDDRYATARDLADDLGRFLAGEPIVAARPTQLTRLCKWGLRHKRAVAATASLVAGCVLVVLAAAAYVAGARAAKQQASREAAENSRRMVQLLYDVPMQTAEQLAGIPGTEGVRRQLLQEGLQYFVRLSQQAYRDPALGADLALAYSKIGGLAAELGDSRQALAAHRDARRILERRAAREPNNGEVARGLALCRNNAGMVLARMGRLDEAAAELQAARAIQQRLCGDQAGDVELAAERATTYGNLGLVAKRQGDATSARRWFHDAIKLAEPLAAGNSAMAPLARSLAAAYNNLASLDDATGNAAAALANYRQSIAIQARLVAEHPFNQLYQSELGRSYSNLGYAASLHNDWPTAQRAYADAIELQANLVKLSPLTASHRCDLAITYNNLGMALSEIGRRGEARDAFDAALAEQRRLLAVRPHDAVTLSNLGGIYNNAALLAVRQNRSGDAMTAYRDAIHFQRRALEADPTNSTARDLLSRHLFNFATLLKEQGDLAAALAVARKRRDLWHGDRARLESVNLELAEIQRLMTTSTDRVAREPPGL